MEIIYTHSYSGLAPIDCSTPVAIYNIVHTLVI